MPELPSPNGTPDPIRIGNKSALIACTPFLVGFYPDQSIVIVFLDADGLLALTLRLDLPEEPDGDFQDATDQVLSNTMLRVQAHDVHVDAAHVLVFSAKQRGCPAREVVGQIAEMLATFGVDVRGCLATDSSRIWYYDCDAACCGESGPGHPVDEPSVADMRFDMVTRGFGYALSRRELENCLSPVVSEQIDAGTLANSEADLREAVASGTDEAWRREIEDSLVAACMATTTSAVSEQMQSAWAVGLRDSRVREPVMYRLITVSGDRRRAALAGGRVRLIALARAVPDGWVAPVAATLAAIAWQEGDGAFACIAAQRALECDPSNSLGQLIEQAAGSGLPPQSWQEVLESFGLAGLRRCDPYPSGHVRFAS